MYQTLCIPCTTLCIPHVSRAQSYVSRYVECIKPNVSRAQRYVFRYVKCIKPNVSRAQRYGFTLIRYPEESPLETGRTIQVNTLQNCISSPLANDSIRHKRITPMKNTVGGLVAAIMYSGPEHPHNLGDLKPTEWAP
ncbi:hypothetical protein H5410_005488 [Solanum commersonii]|uniref:Uncharacterized protein n=1 Tax=Solanum commersonii TaxID=4109 RepID=A0A9J6A6J2_SOLCO|nr:hypothetical protein H5410_005488 [Solanum commersonii]